MEEYAEIELGRNLKSSLSAKQYELIDHLGNVRAVLSDVKICVIGTNIW